MNTSASFLGAKNEDNDNDDDEEGDAEEDGRVRKWEIMASRDYCLFRLQSTHNAFPIS